MPLGRDHAFGGGPTFGSEVDGPISAFAGIFARVISKLVQRGANRTIWQTFDRNASISPDLLLGQNAWCVNFGDRSDIVMGSNVCCRGTVRRERFGAGRITIGDYVYIGDDTLISCAAQVDIGYGSMIAHGVQIVDNDSHPIDAARREEHWKRILAGSDSDGVDVPSRPVRIGSRCWLGFNSIILKGVTIGDGSVVAAGSVVTRDVPANTVVAGNPASPVRPIAPSEA